MIRLSLQKTGRHVMFRRNPGITNTSYFQEISARQVGLKGIPARQV